MLKNVANTAYLLNPTKDSYPYELRTITRSQRNTLQ